MGLADGKIAAQDQHLYISPDTSPPEADVHDFRVYDHRVDLAEARLLATSFPDAVCGNGVRERSRGEKCDDGNSLSGDGCSDECTIEDGFICAGASVARASADICVEGTVLLSTSFGHPSGEARNGNFPSGNATQGLDSTLRARVRMENAADGYLYGPNEVTNPSRRSERNFVSVDRVRPPDSFPPRWPTSTGTPPDQGTRSRRAWKQVRRRDRLRGLRMYGWNSVNRPWRLATGLLLNLPCDSDRCPAGTQCSR